MFAVVAWNALRDDPASDQRQPARQRGDTLSDNEAGTPYQLNVRVAIRLVPYQRYATCNLNVRMSCARCELIDAHRPVVPALQGEYEQDPTHRFLQGSSYTSCSP